MIKRKRRSLFTAIVIIISLLVGCENSDKTRLPGAEETTGPVVELPTNENDVQFSFADISNHEFWFGSGAGAWRTVLTIHDDGTFVGEYVDSNMEVTFVCNFTGKFTEPVKVDDYTYSVTLEQIELEKEPDTVEIKDGLKVVYSNPYGLNDAEELLFYLPGAPIQELPEEYRSWMGGYGNSTDTQLPFYGLYNVNAGQGFTSHEKVNAEQQLAIFAEYFEDWVAEEERDWWGYAVTDLDQDGQMEVVTSEIHGTGHYTTTSIHEMGPDGQYFTKLCTENSCESTVIEDLAYGGPLPCSPLIMPHFTGTGIPQTYPVYYDSEQDVYYYSYEDSVDYMDESFSTQRSFSLQGEEATGIFLGYKKTVYHGNYTSVDCWDAVGNYINKDRYETIPSRYYSGLDEMEVHIQWIECQHLGDMSKDDIYAMLKESMDAFMILDK